MKKSSSFCPGMPVPIEFFIGRKKEIKAVARLIAQTAEGRSASLFIKGEQGIGKSSLANLSAFLARSDNSVLPRDKKLFSLHLYMGAVESLKDVCQVIVKGLFAAFQQRRLLGKARKYLAKYLESLRFDLFGLGLEVRFRKDKSLDELPLEFPSLLYHMWKLTKKASPHYKGLMLILDDIERACNIESFSPFLKSLMDHISSQYKEFPLLLVLLGEDSCLEKLSQHHPSITTMLQVIELPPHSREESAEFLTKALQSVNLSPEEKALEMMVSHSGGFPLLLHEIGEAVYWCDSDGKIDEKDVIDGLLMAAHSLGEKQFRHLLYRRIRDSQYRSILFRLAKMPPATFITIRLLKGLFPQQQSGKIAYFIKRMLQLGVFQLTARSKYQFSSQLLRLYLLLTYVKGGLIS